MNTFKKRTTPVEALEARIVPATFHWNVDAGGNWNDPNNWFNETTNMVDGFPNGPDDVAKFEGVITANRTIIIPDAVRISAGGLVFNDDNVYTLAPIGSAGLVLESSSSTVNIINNGTASPLFTVPLILDDNLAVNTGAGGLRIAASILEMTAGKTLAKDGDGTLTLGDGVAVYDNSHTGTTFVNEGTLELNVVGDAIIGNLIIANTSSVGRVEVLRSGQLVDTTTVLVRANGIFDLNANDETVALVQYETAAAGSALITGTGTLTVNGNINHIGATGASPATAVISSKLSFPAGSHTISVGAATLPALEITGVITGAGDFQVSSTGTLRIGGTEANTSTGAVSPNIGATVILAKPDGVTAANRVFVSGTLILANSEQIAAGATVRSTGLWDFAGHDETVTGLSLASGATRGSIVNTGTGTLTLTGSIQHSVDNGGMDGAVGAVINGKLALAAANISANANDGSATDDITINAVISGAGTFSQGQLGNLRLNGANTYTGAMTIFQGSVTAGHASALGATGAGNGTQVNNNASLRFAPGSGTINETVTLVGTGVGGTGALVGPVGTNGDVHTFAGALRLSGDATITAGEQLVFSGQLGATDDARAILTVDAMQGSLALTPTATFSAQLNTTTPGTGHDQLRVLGPVNLGGAALNVGVGFAATASPTFVIVDNDGADAISGTFAGLAEGATLESGGRRFTVSYIGGDGNDVTLTALPIENDFALSADMKSATFTDVDGDLVTVKITKGTFAAGDFTFIPYADNRHFFESLRLDAAETGANVTITAKRTANGGNGFVNVEYLNATGVDLGVVKIGGDLGYITAGTVGGDAKVPGIKSLAVHSISVPASTGGIAFASVIEGALPKLVTKGDLRGSVTAVGADGKLGTVTIGGSFRAHASGVPLVLSGDAGIGAVKIAGDVGGNTTIRSTAGAIGSISIGGELSGGTIEAFGAVVAPAKGVDLALGKLTVKGAMHFATIRVGAIGAGNADASIGSIAIGGDWRGGIVMAGATEGADTFAGTADDAAISGAGVRNDLAKVSTIGSITVGGQVHGTVGTTDNYGITAGAIGKVKLGTRTLAFTKGANEAFFAAATSTGMGTENPAFDFAIRELGAATPVPAFGGVNLVISLDGKTATYTDADGDLVTVKRSAGSFAMGDFTHIANTSGGGALDALTVTPAANNAPVNLSITAKPGANGGNGFANVRTITATGTVLGNVAIGGDLSELDGGLSVNGKPGIASLTVHSFGATNPSNTTSTLSGGLGKLAVKTDVRFVNLNASAAGGRIGAVTIGGSVLAGQFLAADGITSIKTGGTFQSTIEVTKGALGSLTVGGNLSGSTIRAFGQLVQPVKGPDIAIKSITVKGGVNSSIIEAGGNPFTVGQVANADASIGKITVGRDWHNGRVTAGTGTGNDGFVGTGDDAKIFGTLGLRDRVDAVSTIASVIIKGHAHGSGYITSASATSDSFGIVAEQISKATIGKITYKLDKGPRDAADTIALGSGTRGPTGLPSDFHLRELVL